MIRVNKFKFGVWKKDDWRADDWPSALKEGTKECESFSSAAVFKRSEPQSLIIAIFNAMHYALCAMRFLAQRGKNGLRYLKKEG